MANIDKKILKRLKLLYAEDDLNIRNELSALLSKFFANIYTADDGQEALEIYREKQDDIDIIVADINMPRLTGIEMVQKIREFDSEVPVVFITAYSDTSFLIEAIKLKAFDYIVKPIDIRMLMKSLSELSNILYQEFLLDKQNQELKKYKDILDKNNIVIKTNKDMKIAFVNKLFCGITGFNEEELKGKEFSSIGHKDSDLTVYKDIYTCVQENKKWQGQLKNITKDSGYYISYTTVVSDLNESGEIVGALIIQKDETRESIKRRDVQSSLIKDKSEIFKKSKKNSAELLSTINSLKNEIDQLNKDLNILKQEKDKYIYISQKFTIENKKLKKDLKHYQKDASLVEEKGISTIKLAKENSDLKVELKRLNSKLETIEEEHKKEILQLKVNHEVEIDDLEQELNELKNQFDESNNMEALSQKLSYWKERAKKESKKLEKIERDIISYGDKKIMKKLFGER